MLRRSLLAVRPLALAKRGITPAAAQRLVAPVGGVAARAAVRPLATTSDAKPFRVLGLQQVAIGGLEKGKLSALWQGQFGLDFVKSFVSERENVDEDVLKLGRGPFAVEIDLMQPVHANKKPAVHIPALNHIGLWVDDLPAAVEHLTEQGMRFTPGGIRPGASGYDVCFIHPVGNGDFPICGEGVLIELVQAPPEVVDAYDALA
uniref:VOC domain-containing protein n=1 Tax=Phaeomonas parva TaxID=124430 RepID=A0A7S1UK61_9STRA|mmetsp:Transcript_9338/g.27424  ORF Transcript_9338/g.27424 Transcript_9338/m.27424 type:complete len:204 (+) Transcript_9338:93-704(+)|eukprot:CAMPEP_0118867694 /NCGR_PEP_ID=MMETSP1163-20130328/11205_1 /TAXON_ID=124430 /ORGANISM="Phaeomonas parva, Strain CCMP2877" /LENGTH=203 /DNA_ID=CAMNT_0006802137 /DNA_START=201 /DNA_END=812 /DNA_ORIENTATION=+